MQKSLLWYINVAFEYILKDSALVSFIFHYTGQDFPQKLPFCVRWKKKKSHMDLEHHDFYLWVNYTF